MYLKAILLAVAFLIVGGSAASYAQDQRLIGNLRVGTGTATATSGQATCNNKSCLVTTEDLTTTSAADYRLNVSDTGATASDFVLWSIQYASNTDGSPRMGRAWCIATGCSFIVGNSHVSQAFNGALKIFYLRVRGF